MSTPSLSPADAQRICDLLRAGKTDPDMWTPGERAAVTRLHSLRDTNPMDGAIQRVLTNDRLRGYDDIHLALNEAFRNGLKYARSESDSVSVEIDGVHSSIEEGGYGRWIARRIGETDVYRLDGDVKDVVLEEHTCSTPIDVRVIIAGLYPPANYEHAGSQGSDNNRTWLARWYRSEMRDAEGRPVYTILGDPNGAAVGRFKASLRKFLGVD